VALPFWFTFDAAMVPVIVLGEPESDLLDRVRALDRGCDDFLARPFA
jgi:DNA-binding response OmpR family regulator